MKRKIFTLACMLFPVILMSQWSNNPMINDMISDIGHQSTFSKVAANGKGICYISNWVATTDTNHFALYLQRIDSNGYRKWGDSGILISDHHSKTWLSDYSLIADDAGNAYLFIEDLRVPGGFSHVYGYSVDSSGNMRWGANGIMLDNNVNTNCYSPASIISSGGNLIIAWNVIFGDTTGHSLGLQVQKLTPNGEKLWAIPVVYTGPDSTNWFPNLVPTISDGFIVGWVRFVTVDTVVGGQEYRYYFAQRYDSLGNPVWAQKAVICDLDTLAFEMPTFPDLVVVPDTAGGAYYAWSDDRTKNSYFNTYVQHIDKNGNLRWQTNGIPVSTYNVNFIRRNPGLCYLPGSNELTVFWSEMQYLPSVAYLNLTGQKFSLTGTREWGDTGKIFCSSANDSSFTLLRVIAGSASDIYAFYEKGAPSAVNLIYATRLDIAGTYLWEPDNILMGGDAQIKTSPVVCAFGKQFVAAWQENRTGLPTSAYGQIYAQNITAEGKLGLLSVAGGLSMDNSALLLPNPSEGFSAVIFKKAIEGPAEVSILSCDGKLVMQKEIPAMQQFNYIPLNGTYLSPGMYLVRINTGEDNIILRWVITR